LAKLELRLSNDDEEFALYRREHSNPSVSHNEYSLRDELDSAWAIRSQAFSEQRGQTALMLEDPGR